MRIDVTQFPLVWFRLKAPVPGQAAVDSSAFETLLARRKEFVLLNDEGVAPSSRGHLPEAMEQDSPLMKQHRSALRTFVKAAIFIEPSTAMRLATYDFSSTYERFWGYPMHMVATQEDALALAWQLLQDRPTDAILEFL